MYSEGAVDACTIDRLALLIEPPDRWAHALQGTSKVSSWGQRLDRWAPATLPLGLQENKCMRPGRLLKHCLGLAEQDSDKASCVPTLTARSWHQQTFSLVVWTTK